MSDMLFIRARALALRWGMEAHTKNGGKSNHTQFLQRTKVKHLKTFPTAYRLGGRTVYKIEEIEAFERALPKRAA